MNPYQVAPPPQASGGILPLHPSGRELFVWAREHQKKSPKQIQKLLQPFVMKSPAYQGLIDYYINAEANEEEYYQKYTKLKAKYDGLVAHHGIVHGG